MQLAYTRGKTSSETRTPILVSLLLTVGNANVEKKAKKFLDPTTLFHIDTDEALQRVSTCVRVMKRFHSIFTLYKENIDWFFKDREPEPWNFHPNVVFERYNAFLSRLETISWFFNTVLEFTRLERVEIGGMKGRVLSNRVTSVSQEFQQHFSVFSTKSYDFLDPDDPSFINDFETFKQRIFEMDLKLAAILCQAFEDCANLESIFKVTDVNIVLH